MPRVRPNPRGGGGGGGGMEDPLSLDVADPDMCDLRSGGRLLTLLLSALKSTGIDAVSE